MIRNGKQWQAYFKKNFAGGYIADGDGNRFYELSVELFTRVQRELEINKFGRILDIGCANGRIPISLDSLEIPFDSYLGIEVNPRAVHFCRKAFDDEGRYNFSHAKVHNKHYVNSQKEPLESYSIPGYNYNVVIAESLFTHLGKPANAQYYLSEVSRTISGDGLFYSTWFRSPVWEVSHDEAMCVYPELEIRGWLNDVGFKIVYHYGGDTKDKKNQWRIVCRKM
jgi:SAM-dependent methyltransferase